MIDQTRLLEVIIPLECKNDAKKHQHSWWCGSCKLMWVWGRWKKRACKEAEKFPDFKRINYNGISKTVFGGQSFSYKPNLERQLPKFRKNTQFLYFSCENLILLRLYFYFEIEIKTAIFKVILPNFCCYRWNYFHVELRENQ